MVNLDLDHLRKIYSEYTTEELIKYILVGSDELVPKALSVIREEFQKRGGDIKTIIKKENYKSGLTEFLINDAQYFVPAKHEVIGNLYLTSNGIYFIPTKSRTTIVSGAFTLHLASLGLAPLGAVFDTIISKGLTKLSEEKVGDKVVNKNLPLSLVTKYVTHSYQEDIKNIKSVAYFKSGDIKIVTVDLKTVPFLVDKTDIPLVETWISSHKIPFTMGKGFFESILGKLKIFEKDRR